MNADEFRKKDTINLRREVIANGINDFNFTPQRDKVLRMRFMADEEENTTHLRIYMHVNGEDSYSDVNLADHVSILRRISRHFDAPILNVPDDLMTPQMATR